MHQAPQRRGRGSARPAFLLVSVLALLALLSVPGLAQAEQPSSGVQYESEELNSGVKKSSNIPPAEGSPKAHSSTDQGGSESPESSSEEPSKEGGGAGQGSNGGNGKGNEGSGSEAKQHSSGSKDATGLSESKPLGTSTGKPASSTSNSGGSSSPLVPILIVIAVLAAVSVGVVLYRQRKQRPGSSVSPKAS